MKFINAIIIALTKLSSQLLHLLGRNAGTVPGRIALTLSPHILDAITTEAKIIVVTGTNGKTTTTNILSQVLTKAGHHVISNHHGNNISWGIATTLLCHAKLSGHLTADYLVLETDEHWVPVLFSRPNLRPDTLIVLDFFRDQLDRAGEMETIIQKLETFVRSYPCNLILNGDDPNIVRIGRTNTRGHNFYYGVAKISTSTKSPQGKLEGIICPYCKSPLVYDFYQYSHLGHFHCPKCDYQNLPYVTEATKITGADFYVREAPLGAAEISTSTHAKASTSESTTTSAKTTIESTSTSAKAPTTSAKLLTPIKFTTTNPNIYHIYNLLAIITCANLYGAPTSTVKSVISNYQSINGRDQIFHIAGHQVLLNLCKNPTGCNVVLNSLRGHHSREPQELLFVINDHVNDGHDVSWLWDIDLTDLGSFRRIICAGTRAYDIAIPIKCNGYPVEQIIVHHDPSRAIAELLTTPGSKSIISNYSPLVEVQTILQNLERSHHA